MEDSSRWTTVRAIYTRQKALWLVPGLIYAAFAAWRDEAPDSLQPPILADVLTWIPWWVGIIAALLIALVVLFEGAHREINAAKKEERVGKPMQAVANSVIAGPVVQSQSPITAGRDVTIATAVNQKEKEPSVHLEAATSDDGRSGYLYVVNPGIAEKFSMRISAFLAGYTQQEIRPRWQAGGTEQFIKKGDKQWCLITSVEPDKVPTLTYRGGSLSYPIGRKADLAKERDRRERGVRIVRFYGDPQNQDVEVKVGEQYFMEVTVFSDTRDPVTENVSYGVAANEKLVMPFDPTRVARIEEERKKLLEKVMEPVRTPEIGTKEESQIKSESDES